MKAPKWWKQECPAYSDSFKSLISLCENANKFKRKIKPLLIEEQDHNCARCDRLLGNLPKQQVHLHHIDYSGGTEFENNDPSNLIVLCRRCHLVTHLKFTRGKAIVPEGMFFETELMKFTMRFLKWRYIYKATKTPMPLMCHFIWRDFVNDKNYDIYIAPQDSRNRPMLERLLIKQGMMRAPEK